MDVERTAFEIFPAGVAAVTHGGDVSWASPIIMQSLCKIKVNGYPFDVQVGGAGRLHYTNYHTIGLYSICEKIK